MNDTFKPGEGYRLLELGETVESGDEFFQSESERWLQAEWASGQHVAKTWRPMRRKLPAPAPSTGWIKCSERLPVQAEMYLCFQPPENDGHGFRLNDWMINPGRWGTWKSVTHWMPLPAPPEPEKDAVELAAEAHYREKYQPHNDKFSKEAVLTDFRAGVEWARSQKP